MVNFIKKKSTFAYLIKCIPICIGVFLLYCLSNNYDGYMTLSTTKCAQISNNSIDKSLHWFAANTKPRQEKFIRDRLNALEIENFIPTRIEIRQWKYRKKKVEMPIIPHLVFIHTDFDTSFSLPNDYKVEIWYIKDRETKTSLIVPDKQMQDFMLVLGCASQEVEINPANFSKGDKVRVISGPFTGIEGELERKKDQHRVIINLQGVASLAVEIAVESLQIIQ